jgi:hypothetical protein
MNKLYLFAGVIILSVFFAGCASEEGDREKIVEMTIYPETGYGGSLLSDILTEPILFSDNDENQKQMLTDIITEGFDFDYERGYEYTLKVKKVWMQNPPQDVSSVKYVFIELLTKKKVITEDSEKKMVLFVSSQTVKFTPQYPCEYENLAESEVPKIYDALHVKENGTDNWMALTNIEGFDYLKGYEYLLNVKKITQATPYSIRYILLDIISTKKTEK